MTLYDSEFTKRCTTAFAEPSASNLIDLINPATGKSAIEGETLEQIRVRYPTAEIVNIEEWLTAKAGRQDTPIAWTETTEERFNEMLEVLPPAAWFGGGFLVGEPYDHHATTGRPRYEGYKERHGKYFVANRPMTRAEFKIEMEKD